MTELRHRAGITSSIGTSCNGTKRHPPSTLLLIQSRAEDRPPHRVVRPELKYGKQAWQHAPVMIGPGTTHHLVDAPVQSALRMALLDDRRQLGLTGDRENDIADAPRWFIDRGAGDLDRSEEHTSELQSLMRISYAVFCLKKNNLTQTSNKATSTTNRKTKHSTPLRYRVTRYTININNEVTLTHHST